MTTTTEAPVRAPESPDVPLRDNRRVTAVLSLRLDSLVPSKLNQRRHSDAVADEELYASIKERGIVSALLVRPRADGKYEIVAGARRYRAAIKAGLEVVPAVVKELSDADARMDALAENVQRQTLTPIDEARASGNCWTSRRASTAPRRWAPSSARASGTSGTA